MIHRVFSDLATFRQLEFHSGFNLLLSDKSPGASERQTRNAAGKTSLVELVHFLLGDDCRPDSVFRSPELVDATFGMTFNLAGGVVEIRRTASDASRLEVSTGTDTSGWPMSPHVDRRTGRLLISNSDWKTVLGALMFGLRGGLGKYAPSFRSILSYFARRQRSQGFAFPVKQSERQQPWDSQVAISFLLGLDWTLPQQWQLTRDREKRLDNLREAAAEGALGSVVGSAAELFTQLAIVEQRVDELRSRVANFRIVPEYHDLEVEAAVLTQQLGDYADANTADRQLVDQLEEAMSSEVPPSVRGLESAYAEVGIALPGVAVRRFDDVRAFHQSVVDNRRSYLAQELDAARTRIREREQEQARLDARRSQVMAILKSSGALEQYSLLQSEVSRMDAQAESIRQRHATAEMLERQRTELDIERGRLLSRLQQDHQEQRELLREAITAFEKTSNALYENPGNLTISASANGPDFSFQIPGGRSKGVNNMQIFCFDLMLIHLWSERGMGTGFLLHDSHLFDGVDQRQVVRALQVASEASADLGFQYVVTMNSDKLPRELSEEFVRSAELPIRLIDDETGGLFGFRFG